MVKLHNIRRPNSFNSCIDISFSSPNFIWHRNWFTVDEPNGSDHFLIIISVKLNVSNLTTKNSHINLSSVIKFSFNKAKWSLFSQLINSAIPSLDTHTCSLEAYKSIGNPFFSYLNF